jgi:multiple sugar transport system permease protein
MSAAATLRWRPGLWLGGGLAVAFFLLPILYLVSVSLKTPDEVLTGSFLPAAPTLANWQTAFAAVPLLAFLRNSVVVALASSLLCLAIALPATYAMVRLGVGGRVLPSLTLGSYVAPPIVALVPLFLLLRKTGLIDTQAGLALVYALSNLPVAVWLLAGFIRRVPPEIDEAAALDGAGQGTILIRVIAPLIAPGLVAAALIVGILAYDELLLASVFTYDAGSRTLPVGVSLFQGDRLVNFGQMAVASLTGIVPVYLVGLALQRRLIGGLAAGGLR